MTIPSPDLINFLREKGLASPGEDGVWNPLTGGVSSDIWHVRVSSGDYCVKRALPELKTKAKWQVSTDRNNFEWAYLRIVETIAPGHVPQPIAHDPSLGLIAMAWLPPATHQLWKTELLDGRVNISDAVAVGTLVGRIHQATASSQAIADSFATDANFEAIRLNPYFRATGDRHPTLKKRLNDLADMVAERHTALVHGDISPKNILFGAAGPVLLDAECAWYGDPAFDVAFCLNHLVIKSRVVHDRAQILQSSAQNLFASYCPYITWEDPKDLEARVAELLPALALARVDGKSPLEYLSLEAATELRLTAIRAIESGPATLAECVQRLSESH